MICESIKLESSRQ
uniref:Uncharacterized protein n=1 Tax=Lepeophtheirus salmonis TaxID=72036 RepID=A0A0K2TI94_LEPSM